jgi:hypothetical protein
MELLPLRLGVDGEFAPKLKLKAISAVFALSQGCCDAIDLKHTTSEVGEWTRRANNPNPKITFSVLKLHEGLPL